MTSIFPHPPHAEDQPYSRTILTFHVLRSGFATGATLSLVTSSFSLLYSRIRHASPLSLSSFTRTALLHSSRGTPAGFLLSGLALASRMHGREEIEWQDRSWRLLESRGQVECDWWLLGGAAMGALAGPALLRRSAGNVAAKAVQGSVKGMGTGAVVTGSAGLGSVAGMLVYLARPGSPSRGGREVAAPLEMVKEEVGVKRKDSERR